MSEGAEQVSSDARQEPALEVDILNHTSVRPGQWLGPLGPAHVSPKAARLDRVPAPSLQVRGPVDGSMPRAPLATPMRAGLDPCLLLALGLSTPDGGAGGRAIGHVPPTRAGVLMAFAARWRLDRIALRHHIWKAVHAGDLERALALAEVWETLEEPGALGGSGPASSQQQQQADAGDDWRAG